MDLQKRGKNMVSSKELDENRKKIFKSWITLFRNNISIFCEFYLGVNLFPYQRYWIHNMGRCTNFMGIASRATGKSWLIGLWSIARCILYPGTIISINSSTKQQAGLILTEKCQQLYNDHAAIRRETLNIVKNQNLYEMTFRGGSKIEVVISGEAGRGHRSNVAVFLLVPQ